MLHKAAITALAAAAMLAATASAPTYAAGAPHGAAGNWLQEGTWNWPIMCKWELEKVYVHKRPTLQWVKRCQ